jgi:quinol-cytochrome oxidoreductase complex cytochrome b subunit
MLLSRRFLLKNKMYIAICIFLLVFWIFHTIQPNFAYHQEGGFRPFGTGYKHKTVVPVWLVAIFLAILSYLAVMSYILLV